MRRELTGVHYGNPTPGKPMLHIFAKQHPAAILSSDSKKNSIPDLEPMINRQIKSRLKCRPGAVNGYSQIIGFPDWQNSSHRLAP